MGDSTADSQASLSEEWRDGLLEVSWLDGNDGREPSGSDIFRLHSTKYKGLNSFVLLNSVDMGRAERVRPGVFGDPTNAGSGDSG